MTFRLKETAMSHKLKWKLLFFDTLVFWVIALFIFVIYPSAIIRLSLEEVLLHTAVGYACVLVFRLIQGAYRQIWRYAGPTEYMGLVVSDGLATVVFLLIRFLFPERMTIVRAVALFTIDLLGCIMIRMAYQWIYLHRSGNGPVEKFALGVLRVLTGYSFADEQAISNRIRVAIIGAGSIGVMLADELLRNPRAVYEPVCFVDVDKSKAGREIGGIPVLANQSKLKEKLDMLSVQEVVFALPHLTQEQREKLYGVYNGMGYKIKVYDYPMLNAGAEGRRSLHDFDIEDLLFRHSNPVLNEETAEWYRGKNILITGGGGSIGSELARQIAGCGPSRLVLLDVYENGVYDIQQELVSRYGKRLNLRVEIASVCDRGKMEKIFADHTPDIVLHAAAHKHVPLMERNVCEAVSNNVFGTLNVVELCEKYNVGRFIMISTDKAVNPTNVMGATKRMCEMIVLSRKGDRTSFSATRFGNVLGSNGSVIPLFRKQIAAGGPVTVTDKRIIRYFMTIPEASQLVMTSGAMAKNGELYVLDMGKPVKIVDLAENMIRLSGLEPGRDIEIVETGLRPGEKLYEELLIKTGELDKTENELIFVERDEALAPEEIEKKLDILRKALATQSNRAVKAALMEAVPTYRTPEEVNCRAEEAEEMARGKR